MASSEIGVCSCAMMMAQKLLDAPMSKKQKDYVSWPLHHSVEKLANEAEIQDTTAT
jgi:hypothetical protein